MDPSFINFLMTVVVIGLAISVPVAALMYVRSLTRAKQQIPLEELDEIYARLAEVEAVKERLMEVEERLDFAERLLEQQREPKRIAESEHLTPV